MGQCVSSGTASANNNGSNVAKPDPRCQTSGCQKACDPGLRSRYCAQHAACRRQGCTRPRYRKGPYCQEHLHTCRVSRCSNDQVRAYDARFTNHLCWDHQPDEIRDAWFSGNLFVNHEVSGEDAADHQQQRTRRRRSRQKPNTAVTTVDPVPESKPQGHNLGGSSSDSGDDDVSDVGRRLSTIREEADRDGFVPQSARGPQECLPETTPGTPTARRSQKTVHFAESPPRASSSENHHVVTADVWVADPVKPPSTTGLRSSRHRRSVDGRHGTRSSPKASSSSVAPVVHNREKRRSTGSAPKTADVKRAPRSRSSP